MAKNKEQEKLYKLQGKLSISLRKKNRLEKFMDKKVREKQIRESGGCPVCGEDPYCYCGDGTPYSY